VSDCWTFLILSAAVKHLIRVIPISLFENEWKPLVVDQHGHVIARTDRLNADKVFHHLSHLFQTRVVIALPDGVEAPRVIGHGGRNLKEVFTRTGAVATVYPTHVCTEDPQKVGQPSLG